MRESDRYRAHDQVAFGALVGVGVVAVLQFLSLNELDNCLKLALYCFAISIPILSSYLLSLFLSADYDKMANRWYNFAAIAVGGLAFILGFGAAVWHLSRFAGALFGALCVVGFFLTMASAWDN